MYIRISNADVIVFVIKRNTCITSPKLTEACEARDEIGDFTLLTLKYR